MAIVAGADFGTLSVRVTIVDTERGRLGSGVAEYPLHRKKDDPDQATQSHDDHMRALAEATRKAAAAAAPSPRLLAKPLPPHVSPATKLPPSPSTPPAPASFPQTQTFSRSMNIICGATIALGAKPR